MKNVEISLGKAFPFAKSAVQKSGIMKISLIKKNIREKPETIIINSDAAPKKKNNAPIIAVIAAIIVALIGIAGVLIFVVVGSKNKGRTKTSDDYASENTEIQNEDEQDTSTEMTENAPLEVYIGDSVKYGSLPFHWYVIDKEDDRLLLVSIGIVSHGFSSVTNWGTSDIRTYLNNDFISSLSEDEKEHICDTTLTFRNSDEPDCTDKVFIPSDYEMKSYFAILDDEIYALGDDNLTLKSYWLRDVYSFTNENGDCYTYDISGNETFGHYNSDGIRAMMWVSTSGENYVQLLHHNYNNDNKETVKDLSYLRDAEVGEKIRFGNYKQSALDKFDDDLEWRVLDKADNKILVITDKVISFDCFEASGNNDANWSNSTLRKWLNTKFYGVAFSNQEQKLIAETHISTPDDPKDGTSGGPDTDDKMFLLSTGEADKYFTGNEDRIAAPTHVTSVIIYDSLVRWYEDMEEDGFTWCTWWLRSPGVDNTMHMGDYYKESKLMLYISGSGQNYEDGYASLLASEYAGVRPVMWIDLSKIDE